MKRLSLLLPLILARGVIAEETPLTPEQEAFVDKLIARAKPRYTLGFDVFMKGLYQNNQTNGSVWLGNPHPEGDNYSGQNGIAAVLGIRVDGRVNEKMTAGARLETRFGQQFADFYENGDLAVDDSGSPQGVDATGESLGMNHAAYAQLRGIYIQWDRPAHSMAYFRAGSSDLALWNAWTVGKVRFIDRDNAKGFFVAGEIPSLKLSYNLARISLPKLYASAGFNTGIADPFVENPFWARDAAYAGQLRAKLPMLDVMLNASYLLDEEADLDDPDALGSTNLLDAKDGVVTTIPRYTNANVTLEGIYRKKSWKAEVLVGASRSSPDLSLVSNTIDGSQGLSPIPLATVSDLAIRARFDAEQIAGTGFGLRAEYFNIGPDWVATLGTRREDDALYTTGFLDGQLPTLNLANEFMDFAEPFYETIIGWHGVTLVPRVVSQRFVLDAEGTLIGYRTDAQDRCTSKDVPGCAESGGIYPDFLFPDGMTDTDFFTFANTNDRGRDPRAAYRTNQKRMTVIGYAHATVKLNPRLDWELSAKYIRDEDLRDTDIVDADDYLGHIFTAGTRLGWKLSERTSAGLGFKADFWDEVHRSGAIVAGEPSYPDYLTTKTKFFVEGKYAFPEGAFLSYRIEYLNKEVDATDDALDFEYRHVVRSLAMLYAGF